MPESECSAFFPRENTFFFYFLLLEFELKAYTLSHSISSFFVMAFSQDSISQTVCQGWLRAEILPISPPERHGHPVKLSLSPFPFYQMIIYVG
jgi:hypothetical protein